MGVSKFDKSAAHKRYETRYAGLTTGKQVRLLLRDIHALRIRAEQGDFAAVDVLADLTTAVTRAGLTARQWAKLVAQLEEREEDSDSDSPTMVGHAELRGNDRSCASFPPAQIRGGFTITC